MSYANPLAGRRRRTRLLALAGVVLVPLAFAGLFVAAIAQNDDEDTGRIPAAVVNSDEMVTITNADGTEQPVLAGRQLVTELTAPKDSDDADDSGSTASGSTGSADADTTAGAAVATAIDWQITNEDKAKEMLRSGEVQAVLTIPKSFSSSVISLSGDDPVKAALRLETDDAHSYLSGPLAQAVGDGLASAFGRQLTEQYLTGLYSGFATLGSSLSQASTGAQGLADGATSAQTGAQGLSSGLTEYTGGVTSLSSGIGKLSSGASQLSSGISQYTGGVSQLSAALSQAAAALAANPADPVAQGTVQALSQQLAGVAASGSGLASGAAGVASGASSAASGARQLAASGPALVTGADGLAGGLGELSTGASTLSSGLAEGAAQVPGSDEDANQVSADVAAEPVDLTVVRDNEVDGVGQQIATFFVPLGLWIGALAIFLVMPTATRRALASSAGSGRILSSTLARAAIVAGAQALLLEVLLHTVVGVPWDRFPATLGLSLVMAASFSAFHHFLTVALGRGGLVISFFLLSVQLAATGGLYPVQVLAQPFQALSPFLPMSAGVSAMQSIVAGGPAAPAIGAVVLLIAFGLLSVVASSLAMRRTRRAGALGLLPA